MSQVFVSSFRGNWRWRPIAAVKFNAQDKLLIPPGVSVKLDGARSCRLLDREVASGSSIYRSLCHCCPQNSRGKCKEELFWAQSNVVFLLD